MTSKYFKKSLDKLELNQKAIVKNILITGDIKRRLQDLGIVENTEVVCVLNSPFKEPKAYLVRGAVIVLRKEITSKIIVEQED